MRFLINGYNLRNKPVGIANVVINFINAFASKKDIKIILLLSIGVTDDVLERIEKKENIEYLIVPPNNSMLWFVFTLPKYINKIKPDILWSPTPLLPFFIDKKIKRLITIHDFVSKEYRETMTFAGRIVTKLCEKGTVLFSDYIWCVSKYTKKKLDEYYPKRKCKKIFVGSAPDRTIKKVSLSDNERVNFFDKFNIHKNFLLFVGSLEPRKNLSFLLRVFKEFHKTSNMQLVIVGARTWGKTKISEIVNVSDFPKEDVIFTPFISEKELMTLYSLATCYVSTSLNEGFGLPQAEAMKCGCPVVTAHNSAMIEVVEEAGVTVKDWNIKDWCNAIQYALEHSSEIVEKQNLRIKQYDWNLIADSIYKILTNY